MGEEVEQRLVPHMIDKMGKILDEERPGRRPRFEARADALQRQARRAQAFRRGAGPERRLALIPGFAEGFVQAVDVAALAHHLFEGGRGGARHGPERDDAGHRPAQVPSEESNRPCSRTGARPRVLKIRQ